MHSDEEQDELKCCTLLRLTASIYQSVTTTTTTILWPFFRDYPGKLVPEENFWTLWCKGRLTEADTSTIQLDATPSGLNNACLLYTSDAADE